jgi:hypothetical protein
MLLAPFSPTSIEGRRQEPPLPVSVELTPGAKVEGLADRICARVRDKLVVATEITLAAPGAPARGEYESKLI